MSHPNIQHSTLPPSTAGPPPLTQDATVDMDTVIYSFLEAFPDPTDEQVHHLATLLGFDYTEFEDHIFELLGSDVDEQFGEDCIDGLVENEDIVEDPLDLFLIAYFLINPQPTEEQIHSLALMVNVSPEELEERIYKLLADLENPSEGDGLIEDEDQGDEDDEDDEGEEISLSLADLNALDDGDSGDEDFSDLDDLYDLDNNLDVGEGDTDNQAQLNLPAGH
jgi:hypothetical protein